MADTSDVMCHCTSCKCLKKYCNCFKKGRECTTLCACKNCRNNSSVPAEVRAEMVRQTAARSGSGQVVLACTCKMSRCVKKYCVCFASNIQCNDACGCQDCQNCPAGGKVGGSRLRFLAAAATASENQAKGDDDDDADGDDEYDYSPDTTSPGLPSPILGGGGFLPQLNVHPAELEQGFSSSLSPYGATMVMQAPAPAIIITPQSQAQLNQQQNGPPAKMTRSRASAPDLWGDQRQKPQRPAGAVTPITLTAIATATATAPATIPAVVHTYDIRRNNQQHQSTDGLVTPGSYSDTDDLIDSVPHLPSSAKWDRYLLKNPNDDYHEG